MVIIYNVRFGDSGHSKGTGFVHFETPEEANKAIYAANGGELTIDGRAINASLALPRDEATKMDKEKHTNVSNFLCRISHFYRICLLTL